MGELLTPQELAKYLKLNPAAVTSKAAKGEILQIRSASSSDLTKVGRFVVFIINEGKRGFV